ncbi:hypothetical protein A7U60_g1919 [Sanghuangporus baumii]|uniref:Uncharacterized protein n=1 Tax=Sanghuangporus baumii TaxID=108892 RepID=A0A9Q5N8L6_SANBA|nr:hypothetical protein A7U60_g1919 [Sanghuangporus baumii]
MNDLRAVFPPLVLFSRCQPPTPPHFLDSRKGAVMPIVVRERDSDVEDETVFPLLAPDDNNGVASTSAEPGNYKLHVRTQVSESRRNDEREPPKLKRRTPLPLGQLFVLFGTRLSEPIAYTQIFPYINQVGIKTSLHSESCPLWGRRKLARVDIHMRKTLALGKFCRTRLVSVNRLPPEGRSESKFGSELAILLSLTERITTFARTISGLPVTAATPVA